MVVTVLTAVTPGRLTTPGSACDVVRGFKKKFVLKNPPTPSHALPVVVNRAGVTAVSTVFKIYIYIFV